MSTFTTNDGTQLYYKAVSYTHLTFFRSLFPPCEYNRNGPW